MTSSTPRALLPFALAFAACAGAPTPGRDARLVTDAVRLDRGIAAARQLSLGDGRYDQAAALLEDLRARYAGEPLGQLATLRLARVELARATAASGAEAAALATRAAQLAVSVPAGVDPALDLERDLLLGLLAARSGASAEGLRRLRPLDGRLIEAAQNASVACGLLALETLDRGDPVRALRSLAHVESALERAVRWLPTGLACEDAEARRAVLEAVLPRVTQPQPLADTLDVLPAGYAGRVVIARRLREIAIAGGDLNRWLRWLADLGDQEATITMGATGEQEPAVGVGLLVPLAGPRTPLGVDIVRAVQIALARQRNVQILVEDEGRDLEATQRSYERLVSRGARWIIGPTREELGRAVASWSQGDARGVEIFLLAPWEDALPFGAVHLAAPGLRDRLAAVRAAVSRAGRRVAVVAPAVGAEDGPADAALAAQTFGGRARVDLSTHGSTLTAESASDVRLLAASFLARDREHIVARAASSPARWVVDARVGWQGMAGHWVGVRAGAGFARFQLRFCRLAGYSPGELAILAYDAAGAVLQITRGVAHAHAASWVFEGGDGVAAQAVCDDLVLPRAQDLEAL
ncbi:MAG: hypothetical protein R3A48_16320 [Polyangiales bacterium]